MVLIFAENNNGKLKKTALEAVTYAYQTAQLTNSDVVALTIGKVEDADQLGKYGASKVLNIEGIDSFDSQVYTSIISQVADKVGAKTIILANSSTGKSIAGRLSIRLKAGLVSGVTQVPVLKDGIFTVRKSVFSGKAFADYAIKTDKKVLSLMGNSIQLQIVGDSVPVEFLSVDIPVSRLVVETLSSESEVVPLPEAELVVSAGRGLKAPENWNIIEDLANSIGATTACSRPVADMDWRPHHEHVGQTGIAIRPNLYVGIGISGAIQHLAGVNNSKVIVVINKDPEAPFFKAANYGVCADLFEVVPKLTEAINKFKASN